MEYWRITYVTYGAFDNVFFTKGKKAADSVIAGLSKLKHVSNIRAEPGLMYEDELPPMSDEEYARWFDSSEVVDGVRMGPPVLPAGKYTPDGA